MIKKFRATYHTIDNGVQSEEFQTYIPESQLINAVHIATNHYLQTKVLDYKFVSLIKDSRCAVVEVVD